ncbi:uncharacterized protein C20orf96 homolog isoform X2 [Hemicordylus capensis]|nr:uncharacterized protein C20orf96 homolog isoform X2 [Hemicordylus capensis]XP_053106119.1 uncharacterized protein C20orf96 homolog isoform X2 [Hemicordylus capensis]
MALGNQSNLPKSIVNSLMPPDYSQWQREEGVKKQTVIKGFLPSLASMKEEKGKKALKKTSWTRSKEKPSGRLKTTPKKQRTWHQTAAREAMLAKSAENIRILQQLSKSKMNSLEELKHHSSVLLEKNRRLVKDIKEMDDDTVKRARELLQQYDMFGTVITTFKDSSQNQVGVAKAELQETLKTVEKNMGKLEQERKRMSTKVQALQEELNVLRTYMDKEYPVKAVQISSLLRSIRNLNQEQEDELEDIEDLSKRFLETLAMKAKEEQEGILQTVAEEKLSEYQDGLRQMHLNNMELRRQIQIQKEVIDELMKEIQELQKSIIMLHNTIRDPREVIFADVLLRRPRCSPDMAVVLNIPTEEDFPL